jgi:hypothetical protein
LRSGIATFRLTAAAVSPILRAASEKLPPSAARTKDSKFASVSKSLDELQRSLEIKSRKYPLIKPQYSAYSGTPTSQLE